MENKPSILTEKYDVGRLLGQGNFAKVFYGRSVHTNESVAIKMIDKEKLKKVGHSEQIKREISVMSLAKHPNIVNLHEVMATKSKIYLVLEYCKGGELFKKMLKGKLDEDVAWKYFHQLIDAVDFCHSRGVYHRDIKPENLLLDEHDNLKVSDFGLSALAESRRTDGLLHTACGSHAYACPEIVNRKGYDGTKADVWSCGVVLFVLLTGYLPFYASNLMEMYRKIGKAQFKCPREFPPEAKRLLTKMLDPNPESRITISRIKESSWFKKGLPMKQKRIEKQVEAAGPSEPTRIASMNAFDIIALSSGFALGGLFGEVCSKKESKFTSRKPASEIIRKLEEAARGLSLKIRKQEAGLFKMEGAKEGRKGRLSIDAEIFEVTETFHLVEVKKCNGDTMEYQRMVEEDLRPALADIVWVWQGENEHVLRGLQEGQEPAL
ncbi:CBL-interacting serine/threonine-protein kinase 10 [Raphanus sativus]|nr:CBL-interacting serine/threonine-protein kinase 10 [Raphanus sativus]